jgi:hypothetical protein
MAARMRRTMRYFGSPLAVVDKGLTHSAEDITRALHATRDDTALPPVERPYPLAADLATTIGIAGGDQE